MEVILVIILWMAALTGLFYLLYPLSANAKRDEEIIKNIDKNVKAQYELAQKIKQAQTEKNQKVRLLKLSYKRGEIDDETYIKLYNEYTGRLVELPDEMIDPYKAALYPVSIQSPYYCEFPDDIINQAKYICLLYVLMCETPYIKTQHSEGKMYATARFALADLLRADRQQYTMLIRCIHYALLGKTDPVIGESEEMPICTSNKIAEFIINIIILDMFMLSEDPESAGDKIVNAVLSNADDIKEVCNRIFTEGYDKLSNFDEKMQISQLKANIRKLTDDKSFQSEIAFYYTAREIMTPVMDDFHK